MLPLVLLVATYLVAGGEDASLTGQNLPLPRLVHHIPHPHLIPQPHYEKLKRATTYNITDPIYICPKAGYARQGEDCVYTETVAARWQCPVGYEAEGANPARPDTCTRTIQPTSYCTRGRLVGNNCQTRDVAETLSVCGAGLEQTTDGRCVRYEQVQPTEHCPATASRINGECVQVTYTAPDYICPADTTQEGRKCRREIVTQKERHPAFDALLHPHSWFRKLGEATPSEKFATAKLRGPGKTIDDDLFVDLPEHIFRNDNVPLGRIHESESGNNVVYESTWLPAIAGFYDDWEEAASAPKEWKKADPAVPEPATDASVVSSKKELAWTKNDQTTQTREAPQQRVKEIRFKVPGPPQIIRIQYIPAEKVCRLGDKHGSTCVSQTRVAPIVECPVPLIRGACVRQVSETPTVTCPAGFELNCPPNVSGASCVCERTNIEIAPQTRCAIGKINTARGGLCFDEADPKEYCPLGYFLDSSRETCTKRDVEAALCLFTVTYVCPDATC